MPQLHDQDLSSSTYINIDFIYHIPEDIEGSKLNINFVHHEKMVKSFQIGWANITLNAFIALMKDFPGKYIGEFTHSDESFGVQWIHEYGTGSFILYFEHKSLFLPPLKTNKELLLQFGNQLEQAKLTAPSF